MGAGPERVSAICQHHATATYAKIYPNAGFRHWHLQEWNSQDQEWDCKRLHHLLTQTSRTYIVVWNTVTVMFSHACMVQVACCGLLSAIVPGGPCSTRCASILMPTLTDIWRHMCMLWDLPDCGLRLSGEITWRAHRPWARGDREDHQQTKVFWSIWGCEVWYHWQGALLPNLLLMLFVVLTILRGLFNRCLLTCTDIHLF